MKNAPNFEILKTFEYNGYKITEIKGNVNRRFPSTFRAQPIGNKSPWSLLPPEDSLAEMTFKIDWMNSKK